MQSKKLLIHVPMMNNAAPLNQLHITHEGHAKQARSTDTMPPHSASPLETHLLPNPQQCVYDTWKIFFISNRFEGNDKKHGAKGARCSKAYAASRRGLTYVFVS